MTKSTIGMKRITGILTLMLLAVFGYTQDEKYGDTEEQQIRCKEALSVYKSFRNQKNYDDAYIMWQEACDVCPEDVGQSMYFDGARFLRYMIDKSEGTPRGSVLIDSLMMIYDKRMELYPATSRSPKNKCEILGYKASDYLRYYKDSNQGAFDMFEESLNCLASETSAATLSDYYLTLYYLFKDAEGENQEELNGRLLTDYLTLQGYAKNAIKAAKAELELETSEKEKDSAERSIDLYEKAKNKLDEIFVVIAECDKMLAVLKKKVEAAPEDFELKVKVLDLLNRKDCTDSDFHLTLSRKVYAKDKTSSAAYSIGMSLAKRSEYKEALKYLEEAVQHCPDCDERETYLLKAGRVASALKMTGKARGYAKDIIAINPKSGDAYILQGDAIAGSAAACDDGALGARSVYWLATDYYERARSVDSSVADKAASKIRTMQSQYPTIEDIFTVSLSVGSSFTVPCYGESTKIRVR